MTQLGDKFEYGLLTEARCYLRFWDKLMLMAAVRDSMLR